MTTLGGIVSLNTAKNLLSKDRVKMINIASSVYHRQIDMQTFDFNKHVLNPDLEILYWILWFYNRESVDANVLFTPQEFLRYQMGEKYKNVLLLRIIKVVSNPRRMNMVADKQPISLDEFKQIHSLFN